jgi:hypothetical protein
MSKKKKTKNLPRKHSPIATARRVAERIRKGEVPFQALAEEMSAVIAKYEDVLEEIACYSELPAGATHLWTLDEPIAARKARAVLEEES